MSYVCGGTCSSDRLPLLPQIVQMPLLPAHQTSELLRRPLLIPQRPDALLDRVSARLYEMGVMFFHDAN